MATARYKQNVRRVFPLSTMRHVGIRPVPRPFVRQPGGRLIPSLSFSFQLIRTDRKYQSFCLLQVVVLTGVLDFPWRNVKL